MNMNVTTLIEKVVGDFGDKKRWREYKARTKRLPANYRTAIEALERYLTYFGAITKGDILSRCWKTLLICSSRARPMAPRSARSSGTTQWSSPRSSSVTTPKGSGSTRSGHG